MDKISIFLWFDGQAEEAAEFYTTLTHSSRITERTPSPIDYPGGGDGSVITVAFTLAGRGFNAMNGGPGHPFTDAISLSVDCEGQAEVDHYWTAFSDGGTPIQCGWTRDRFGLSWQVTPRILPRLLADPDRAKALRVMEAMVQMVKIEVAAVGVAEEAA